MLECPPCATFVGDVLGHGDLKFCVTLTLEDGQLPSLSLSRMDADEASSWDTWSEQHEKWRQAAHDRWLKTLLGAPTRTDKVLVSYQYPWGQVSSSFDPRAGASSIVGAYSVD